MPKFLYFDLGNVLVRFNHEIALENLARESGTTRDAARRAIFESGSSDRYERGEVSTGEYCATLRSVLETEISDAAICLAISDMFTLNDGIFPLIDALRTSEIPIGILSNTCQAHWDFINDRFSFTNKFPVQALSFEMGTAKPDPAIYEQAAVLAGIPARDIFFTDDLLVNVEAARTAGFDATLFTTVGKLAADLWERGIQFEL